MISDTQLPDRYLDIINQQISINSESVVIDNAEGIPDTSEIPIQDQKKWLRIPDVICIYVDMINSTQLSAESHDKSTARIYQLFTGTAVKLFVAFDSPYIDVRGDGVFALYNSNMPNTALAAAVTFKTFVEEEFEPRVRKRTDLSVGAHIGIDRKTVLVRKIGLKRHHGRTDKQNEVWAGKPVNMAAKLASLTVKAELLVSDRFFSMLHDEKVLMSCGCPSGVKKSLWDAIDVSSDKKFDFNTAHRLTSRWCQIHGKEYCEAIIALDNE